MADYQTTCNLIREAVYSGDSLAATWNAVTEHICGTTHGGIAGALRRIDIQDEYARVSKWLRDVLRTEPPPTTIRGLRFGLYHPNVDGKPSCDLYLVGSSHFDVEDQNWGYDSTYRATVKPRSKALHELHLISSSAQSDEPALEHICLWFAWSMLAAFCREHPSELRGRSRRRGIGVGFDGGELIVVGTCGAARFKPLRPARRRPRVRKPKLPAGDYFTPEGNRDVLLCTCDDPSLCSELFLDKEAEIPDLLTAHIDPDWLDQRGTFGYMFPFHIVVVPITAGQRLLDSFPNEVRLHRLSICGRSETWCVIQVLHATECCDREASERRGRLTLRREDIQNRNLFFVSNYYEGKAMFLSRDAAQILIDAGVSGVSFVPTAVD